MDPVKENRQGLSFVFNHMLLQTWVCSSVFHPLFTLTSWQCFMSPGRTKIAYYRLNSGPITRDILVAYHPGKHLSAVEQLFIDVLKSYSLLSGKQN